MLSFLDSLSFINTKVIKDKNTELMYGVFFGY